MAHELTVTGLVEEVKRRITIPKNQSLFSDGDIEAFLNDELINRLVPLIMRVNEEFFVNFKNETLVNSQAKYKIPSKAIGMGLRDLWLIDDLTSINANIINVPRLSLEEISDVYWSSQYSYGYYLQGNNVVMYPTPTTTSHILRLFYNRRPNSLSSTLSAKVLSINVGLNEITLDSAPNSWAIGTKVDIQGFEDNYDLVLEEEPITNKIGNVITIADVSKVTVGDYIGTEGYCAVPMIPVEGHRLIAQAATIRCLTSLGDHEALGIAEKEFKQNQEDFLFVLTPRVSGSPKKLNNRNGIFEAGTQYSNNFRK